jgi:hypothetical protein
MPVTIEHIIEIADLDNVGGLQSTFLFAKCNIGLHGDSHGPPVCVSEIIGLPAIKEACISAAFRIPDTRPKLPSTVFGLPDAEIDGLLSGACELTEVGIAGHLPPPSFNFRPQSRLIYRRAPGDLHPSTSAGNYYKRNNRCMFSYSAHLFPPFCNSMFLL